MSLSPRDRRALKLGASVLAPALLFALVVRPCAARLASVREELRAQRALLAQERELVASLAANGWRRDELELARHAAADLFLPSSDPLLAQGELATRIGQLAREANVLVQQVTSEGPEALPGGITAVDLGLHAEGDFEGVLELLRKFEGSRTLFHVRRLSIEAVRPAGVDGGDMEVLAIVATLRAYLRSSDGAGAAPGGPAREAAAEGIHSATGVTPLSAVIAGEP